MKFLEALLVKIFGQTKGILSEKRNDRLYSTSALQHWCLEPLEGNPHENIQESALNLKLFPPGFLRYPMHLQHNHDTDMTEGAVHAKCNGVMWQYHGR